MVLLVLTVLTVAVLSFPAPGPTSIDSLVTGLVRSLPGLFGWFWEISYDLLLIWTLVLVALALFARGRKRLLLEEVLAGARACEASERQSYLAQACGSDAELRARVDRLLAAGGRAETFLETPAAALLEPEVLEDLSGRVLTDA